MSIQFRSRIKPAIDYSDVLNSYGVCCGLTDTTGTPKSFVECFNEGGHFIPNQNGQQASCPDVDTTLGCCAACSFVTPGELSLIPLATPNPTVPYLSSGIRSNISLCECNRRGGKWTEGPCPSALTNDGESDSYWKTWCVVPAGTPGSGGVDVRRPKACCHLGFDPNTDWPTGVTCSNVCNQNECALLGTDVYPSIYHQDYTCASLPQTCAANEYVSLITTRSTSYTNDVIGSCYELNEGFTYDCSLVPRTLCPGYWVPPVDANNAYCDSSYEPTPPTRSGTYVFPQTMGLTTFEAYGLTSGDEFEGGIYIGIFKPAALNGISSKVRGNLAFGEPRNDYFTSDSIGGTYSKWAIIVDPNIYNLSFLNQEEKDLSKNTSMWDGYYNTRGNNSSFFGIDTALSKTLESITRRGFIDYYLPSVYELGFYAQYLYDKNLTIDATLISSSMFNTKYLNSTTNKTNINGNSFVYGQNMKNDSNQYKNVLINTHNTHSAIFFRRIVLT